MRTSTIMRRIVVGVVAVLLHLGAGAQPVPATDPIPRVAFPFTQVGNVSTIGPRTADAANAAKFSYGVASNGAIFANTGDRLPTPGGASIPIGVNGTISKPNVLAALGRFARKSLPLVSTGFALYDLGQELGFGLDNSSGQLQVTHSTTSYTWKVPNGTTIATGAATPNAGWVTYINGLYGPGKNPACGVVYGTTTKQAQCTSTNMNQVVTASQPVTGVQPSSIQAFEDAVAAKSDWPTSSALARATLDAIKSGESPLVEPQTITGPATSPGVTTSTHDALNNTTKLSAATHHHTYAGAQITTTTVTNTTTINNTTSEVIAEEETTDAPVIAEPQKLEFPCGGPGLPACNVKVDETGTPTGSTFGTSAALDAALNSRVTGLATARDSAGDASWGMIPAWTQDQACAPWDLFTLPEAIGGEVVTVDLCPLMPLAEGILNFIWVMLGIFAITSMVATAMTGRGT